MVPWGWPYALTANRGGPVSGQRAPVCDAGHCEMAPERLRFYSHAEEGRRNSRLVPVLGGCIDPVRVQSGNCVQSGLAERHMGLTTMDENLARETENVCDPNLLGLFCD